MPKTMIVNCPTCGFTNGVKITIGDVENNGFTTSYKNCINCGSSHCHNFISNKLVKVETKADEQIKTKANETTK